MSHLVIFKEVSPSLALSPLKLYGGLAKVALTSLVNQLDNTMTFLSMCNCNAITAPGLYKLVTHNPFINIYHLRLLFYHKSVVDSDTIITLTHS